MKELEKKREIDAKMTRLQKMKMRPNEFVIEFSNRIEELTNELVNI